VVAWIERRAPLLDLVVQTLRVMSAVHWAKSAELSNPIPGLHVLERFDKQLPLEPSRDSYDALLVTSRHKPATRSRHIQATLRGAEGHLEAPCGRRYFAVFSDLIADPFSMLFAAPFLDAGATFGSRYDGPSSSRH
jgi:hypothetical protein